jgi:hypothetical protein
VKETLLKDGPRTSNKLRPRLLEEPESEKTILRETKTTGGNRRSSEETTQDIKIAIMTDTANNLKMESGEPKKTRWFRSLSSSPRK